MEPRKPSLPSCPSSRTARCLIGLLCVLVLVGHDVVMTANPHATVAAATAAPQDSTHEPRSLPYEQERHLLGGTVERDHEGHSHDGASDPERAAECGAVRAAALVSMNPPSDTHGAGAALTTPLLTITEQTALRPTWAEPTYPPHVKRALIQVYRE